MQWAHPLSFEGLLPSKGGTEEAQCLSRACGTLQQGILPLQQSINVWQPILGCCIVAFSVIFAQAKGVFVIGSFQSTMQAGEYLLESLEDPLHIVQLQVKQLNESSYRNSNANRQRIC